TAQSIQDYLGLKVVLPWKSRLLASGSGLATAERARELAELSAAASSVSPEFAGLGLFSRALWAGAGASAAAAPGSTPKIAAPLESELLKDAREMAGADAEDMRRVAALAVAALLSHQSDVRELYRSIPPFRAPAE